MLGLAARGAGTLWGGWAWVALLPLWGGAGGASLSQLRQTFCAGRGLDREIRADVESMDLEADDDLSFQEELEREMGCARPSAHLLCWATACARL